MLCFVFNDSLRLKDVSSTNDKDKTVYARGNVALGSNICRSSKGNLQYNINCCLKLLLKVCNVWEPIVSRNCALIR